MSVSINVSNLVRLIIGIALLAFGLLGAAAAIVGIFDPVGSKMADDGDPFGLPRPLYQDLAIMSLYFLCMSAGFWLVYRTARLRRP